MHVGGGHLGAELELLLDAVLLGLGHILGRHGDDKVHGGVGVVLLVVGYERLRVLLLGAEHVLEEILVIGGPGPEGELGDHQRRLVDDLVLAGDVVPNLTLDNLLLDGSVEVAVPRVHTLGALVVEDAADVGDDVSRVVVGNGRGPACADAVGAVDQNQGQDWEVVLGFNHLAVLVEVVEERVIAFGENDAADGREPGENVTGGRVVLTALQAGTELAGGHQQVHVVAPDKILRQADDGGREAGLAVVVRGVLRDVAGELRNFDVGLELTLEAREEHLPLRGLEPVDDGRDRSHEIRTGEEDELLVDEIVVPDVIARHVQVRSRLVGVQPRLAILDALLAEGHVDEITVAVGGPREGLLVVVQRGKVLLGFLGG